MANGAPDFKPGDKLKLVVREPQDKYDARATSDGNYRPMEYIGEVETAQLGGPAPSMKVRWHMPAALGYDTLKGTVSTVVHIADSVWMEARKVARNVGVSVQRISEEEYQKLLAEAASGRPG